MPIRALGVLLCFLLLVAACESEPAATPADSAAGAAADSAAGDAAANDGAGADTLAAGSDAAAAGDGDGVGGDASQPPGDATSATGCSSDLDCVKSSSTKDFCTKLACDTASKTCKASAHPDGTPCDDGNLCTSGDACAAGACKPGATDLCPKPEADCANKKDDDGDGWSDCDDSDCLKDAAACPSAGEVDCKDKADNDKDGKTDCDDSDCAAKTACGTCGHDLCAIGGAEKSGCSDCASKICAADPYCCSTAWDNLCVQQVTSVCKLACGAEVACSDSQDNDQDGKADCTDPDCAAACPKPCAHSVCAAGPKLAENCSPCAKTVCQADQYCCAVEWDATCATLASVLCAEKCPTEVGCDDGLDNDGDGKVDCADGDCVAMAACQPGAAESICDNGKDDDADGKTDCADASCKGAAACTAGTEANCGDKLDEDKDGKTDCDDEDCGANPACATCGHPLCTQGAKLVKGCDPCVDQICAVDAFCCDNSWDAACVNQVTTVCKKTCSSAAKESACNNGQDDDKDGKVDCLDSDCLLTAQCLATTHESNCFDAIDNDGNGATDCADPDCKGSPDCGACKQDVCTVGAANPKGCDVCVSKVCAVKPSCCTNAWDAQCVGLAVTTCAKKCATEVDCANKVDEDGNGKTDCADTACQNNEIQCPKPCTHDTCAAGEALKAGCSSCAATVCQQDPYCCAKSWDSYCVTLAALNCTGGCKKEQGCDDGVDQDKDGKVDCVDADCSADAACQPGAHETECANKTDDDKDGKTDCADFDCGLDLACQPTSESSCADGVDNDGNGAADCQDANCLTKPACTTCGQDLCKTGAKLTASCSGCVEKVCKADPFCCNNSFDSLCVNQVATVCGLSCGAAKEAICNDGKDNDADGKVDCDDFNCFGNLACVKAPHEAKCANLFDEDGDGKTDCADPDCAGQALCAACGHDVCDTGAPLAAGCDACVTKVCLANPACCGSAWGTECVAAAATTCGKKCDEKGGLCGDSVDNDSDGKTDCGDDGCKTAPMCLPKNELSCSDKADEDMDGKTDCADLDCEADKACPAPANEKNCQDKLDGDKDGKTDCADSDCAGQPLCNLPGCPHDPCLVGPALPVACGPCVDQVCSQTPVCCQSTAPDAWSASCVEAFAKACPGECAAASEGNCGNKSDDDKDGKTDCADSDCSYNTACLLVPGELDCGNKSDDDKDGKTDCADADCGGAAACAAPGSCKPSAPLTCTAGVTGNNAGVGSTSATSAWTCKDGTSLDGDTGAEIGYSYLASCDGKVTFALTKTSTKLGFLDLVVLDGTQACAAQTQCLTSAAMTDASVSVVVPASKGQLFTVLVEGYNKFVSDFSLTATCACK